MEEIIYTMKGVSKVFPPKKYVLKDIYLSYFYGAKIGVLGDNGSGKSTLLRILAGEDTDFLGEVFPAKEFKIGYLPQEPLLEENKTVKENILAGAREVQAALNSFNEISEQLCDPELDEEKMTSLLEKQANYQDKIESMDGWEIDQKISRIMEALRCPEGDSAVPHLSGGEKRRVALARLILSNPDILLLDEPTNHLDAESVTWLEHYLAKFPGTVIAVTHDRYFLDNVAGWILELDRGEGHPFKGNYSSWLEQKSIRLEQQEKQEHERSKVLKRELEWLRQTPKARQTKSKARIHQYESLMQTPDPDKIKSLQIYIPSGPRLGEQVIELNDVTKSYGDKLLFENLSLTIPRGAIVGIVGPNGAGKTTLFRLITEQEEPTSGSIKKGSTLALAYVDQMREGMNEENTVWEEISEKRDILSINNYEISSRAYLSKFNFSGTEQQKKIKILSGGEKNRLYLSKLLKQGANFFLLDEPTNDLDVHTIRALEEALLNFGGNVMIISHDRWFLDRVCTHILAFENESKVNFFAGNYSDYEEDLKKRLGVTHLVPQKTKYKKI